MNKYRDYEDHWSAHDGIPTEISWFFKMGYGNYSDGEFKFLIGDVKDTNYFWSALETLCWISSSSFQLVKYIGGIERGDLLADLPNHPLAALGQALMVTSKQFCECGSQDASNDVTPDDDYIGPYSPWRDCLCIRNAGAKLLANIQHGNLVAYSNKSHRKLGPAAFINLRQHCDGRDWVELPKPPYFDRQEVIATFPVSKTVSHAEVFEWCVQWLQARKGMRRGEDVAWIDFKKISRFAGRNREHCFRPAFREAKINISNIKQ